MTAGVSLLGRTEDVGSTPIRRRNLARRRQNLAGVLFAVPFMVAFLAMLVVPLVYAGYLSLYQTKMVGGTVFAGLGNYAQALGDSLFVHSVLRMGRFLLILIPVMLGTALFIALALDSGRVRGSRFVRLAVFVPYAVPGVVAALMWGYLYGREFGPITQVARGLGLPAPNLLSDDTILYSMINIVVWEFVGYNMVIMYSALRSVPTELYDAAAVDGASQLRMAWSIKIPILRPALLLTVIFTVIGCFQLFAEPNLLYHLAPSVVGIAFSPNLYAYNLAFVNQNINFAAAISFLLGFVIMVVSYLVQLNAGQRDRSPRV